MRFIVLITAVWSGQAAPPERLATGPEPASLVAATPSRHPLNPLMPPGFGPSAQACRACHEDVYLAWQTSRHAAASSNAIFQASWSAWPNGWCLDCHAPSAQAQRELLGRVAVPGAFHTPASPWPEGLWQEGVTCVTCHVSDGAILTAGPVREEATAMHAMRRDPTFGDETLCARCHQFQFQQHTPPWPHTYGSTPAQDTVEEWRRSQAAADQVGCIDCHMADWGHRFPGAHTPALVRSAVEIEVTRADDGLITSVLRAPGAPHRIPTGDPFRRLELLLCADTSCTDPLETKRFRRAFQLTEQSWSLLEDTTLPPESDTQPSVRRWRTVQPAARYFRLQFRYGDRAHEPTLQDDDIGYIVTEGPIAVALDTTSGLTDSQIPSAP